MIRTILSELPTTLPQPLSGMQVVSKNGSTSGGTKWTLRTETRDGANRNLLTSRAEGGIEIPKPQSVASLREQIAKKLEVKMPATLPPQSSTATVNRGRARSPLWSSVSNRHHDDALNLQHLAPKVSEPNNYPEPSDHATLQKQIPVAHGPVEKHIPRITQVPSSHIARFSSSVIASPLDVYPSNTFFVPASSSSRAFSPVTTLQKHDKNNDYICYPSIFTLSVEDTISSSPRTVSKNASDQSQTSNLSAFFMNDRTERNQIIKELEIPESIDHSDNVPVRNFRTDTVQKVRSQCDASSSTVAATPTPHFEVLKPVEVRTKMQPESGHHCQLQLKQQNQPNKNISKIDDRHLSTLKQELRGRPTATLHTENSSWRNAMFMKTDVDDQLEFGTPKLQSDNQTSSRTNCELQSSCSSSVRRCTESQNGLEEPYKQSSEYPNRQREKWESGWRYDLGAAPYCKPEASGQLSGGVTHIKKLPNYDVLNQRKFEKFSEELEQQRNRRHGCLPPTFSALQKNFDRFSGLINEFERSERVVTLQTINQAEPVTCTALFSFKAVRPKELSFNRGDVIRVYRKIDMNWMEGEYSGQIGIFPSAYVQVHNNEMVEQINLIALFPFSARNKNELSLKKGEILSHLRDIDVNWIEGKNIHGKIGIFPKSYVREACDINVHESEETAVPDRPKTPCVTTTFIRHDPAVAIKTDKGDETERWETSYNQRDFFEPTSIASKNVEIYRVLYAYKPRNADELELQEDDIVFVIEKCSDGWFIGTLPRTGQFGTFPGNYVERH